MAQPTDKQTTAVVEDLAAALKENEEMYRTAAANATSEDLRELFQKRAERRAEYVAELAAYGETAVAKAPEGGLMDFIHRGIVTIKAAMTLEHHKTDAIVIQECQEAEEKLLAEYDEALRQAATLPPALVASLQRQQMDVQAARSYTGTMFNEGDRPVVVGLFEDLGDAQRAIDALKAYGIGRNQISVVAEEGTVTQALTDKKAEMAQESATAGALGGGAFGSVVGLITGASVMLTMGPVLIVGVPVVAGVTAIGAAVGASYGGLFGALLGWGVGEDDVHAYVKGVREGHTLLAVRVDDEQTEAVTALLKQHNGVNVATRHEDFTEVFDDSA